MLYECKFDGRTFRNLGQLSRHLTVIGSSMKIHYDTFHKTDDDGKCKNCGKDTPFKKGKYNLFCCVECSGSFNGQINGKLERTEEHRAKLSAQNKARSVDWLETRKRTIEKRYGMSYIEHRRDVFVKRLNKMTQSERDAFYEKAVLSQDSGKRSLTYKKYILNGCEVNVQGYEPLILDILKKYYDESSIIVGRSRDRMFKYTDTDGSLRRYFADIFIDNLVFEIKSTFTLQCHGMTTYHKMKAVRDAGKIPILIVIQDPKQMADVEKDLIETISSQAWTDPGRFNDYPFIGVGYKQMITEVLEIPRGL